MLGRDYKDREARIKHMAQIIDRGAVKSVVYGSGYTRKQAVSPIKWDPVFNRLRRLGLMGEWSAERDFYVYKDATGRTHKLTRMMAESMTDAQLERWARDAEAMQYKYNPFNQAPPPQIKTPDYQIKYVPYQIEVEDKIFGPVPEMDYPDDDPLDDDGPEEKPERPNIEFDEKKHKYKVDGEEYPSVTTIIKGSVPTPFSAAAWYGYNLGAEVAYEVVQQAARPKGLSLASFKARVRSKRNPNTNLKKAGDRGTAVHKALENYAKRGTVPIPNNFPKEDQARIRALAVWLLENKPEYLASEVMTASTLYQYVGTFDAYVKFKDGQYKGKTARIDYKTSKSVYPDQHFPQLEAYEYAEIECGEQPSDLRLVIHIPEQGPVEMVESVDTIEDFLVLLDSYNSMQARKERLKKR